MRTMRDWPGRAHVETLRLWPELSQTVSRIEAHPELFSSALLIGSLSRGEGDAISDVDLVAVAQPGRWAEAWEARNLLSSGALVSFDRSEGKPGIAGHSWLTPHLVKIECLITEVGAMRLAGSVAVIFGEDDLLEAFENVPSFTRQEIADYAGGLRESNAISDIERAYGDLITLLRREVRPDSARPLG
jgi:predicted nucleotidyltransferase